MNTPRKSLALARLAGLREVNELRAEQMDEMRPRFQALAGRGDYKDRVAVSFNLFPTPPDIAARLVKLADVQESHRVLEPSAGTGRILDALPPVKTLVAVELCPRLQRHIYENYRAATLKAGDFLLKTPEDLGTFDRIVMNPPFKMGTDIKHIQHALTMLAEGGTLVSLCYAGTRQEKALKHLCFHWEVLPEKSFRAEGTGAGVVMLGIKK